MIQRLIRLFRTAPDRPRLLLFALCAALAFVVGFVSLRPITAQHLITAWGYYYILAMFSLFVAFAWRVLRARGTVWRGWLRNPGWPGLILALASVFVLWSDPFQHKILFDEYVLQGTAFHMHSTKEVATVVRAYDVQGTWQPIDTFLDKRPYFFTFLVSLLHDLTGFRVANIFVLNAALVPVFLGLVYWLGRALAGRWRALLAVGLLATMPLLGQNATGAGMEFHNLAMLALAMATALLYLRAPDDDRLSLLVFTALLLSQSRYESVIFVVPTALVILAGWLRAGRVLLPWPALVAPLLLVPYAWHNRVLSASPFLWQLREGQTSRFSVNYLADNLEGAWKFFFNRGSAIPNSWYLSALGCAGGAWVLWKAWRWSRQPDRRELSPALVVLAAFGGGIAGNLVMLMFYYWSRLDDVMASRFALPMCLLLALLAALLARALDARWLHATRLLAVGLGCWVLVSALPAMASRIYTNQNLVMQEVEWEHAELLKRRGPFLFVTNASTIPYVLWRIPTIISGLARERGAQMRYHLKEGTFKDVIIAQALRPTSAQGDLGVEPDDVMPENYHLETIALKRFGGRWIRLSRVVEIAEPVRAGAGG